MTAWNISLDNISDTLSQEDVFNQIPGFSRIGALLQNNITQVILKEISRPVLEAFQEVAKQDLITFIQTIQKIRSGKALKELEEYSEAIKLFQEVIAVQPRNQEAWLIRSICLMLLGELEKADRSFDRTLDKKDTFEPYYYKALIAFVQSNYEDAYYHIETALEFKDCQFSEIWFDKARILEKLGYFDDAIEAYDQAIKIQPSNHAAKINRSLLLTDEQENSSELVGRAFALALRKRTKDAIAYVDRALELEPQNPITWQLRGNLMQADKNYPAAIQAYQKALSIDENLEESHYGLGISFFKVKRFQLASKAFNKVIEQGSEPELIWLYLGLAKYKLNHHHKALESFEKVSELYPKSILGDLLKGHTLRKHGDFEDAIASYQLVLKKRPHHSEALLCSAKLYHQLGSEEKALHFYQQAHEQNPNDDNIWAMKRVLEDKISRRIDKEKEMQKNNTFEATLEQQHSRGNFLTDLLSVFVR
ncbi:tetratricopeptide repeat protein [Leptothoe sp. EHU-05/26/07-4]